MIVEHYGPLIAKALGGMFSEAAVAGAIEAASKVQADPSSAKSLEKAAGPVMKGVRSGMVSLDLPPGTFPGSDEGDHITIVFLGKEVPDETFAMVCAKAAEVAASMPPRTVSFTGVGTFPPSDASDGKVPVFAVPDVLGIGTIRAAFEEFNASEHTDFKPHCTLAYVEPDEVEGWEATSMPSPVLVAGLSVHLGGNVQTFPFSGGPPPNLRDASTSLERCASCCLANNPDCVKYGGWDVRPDQTCDGWSLAIPGDVMKATEVDDVRQAAIDALKAKASTADLEKLLTELHGDSLLQGAHDAAEAAHVPVVASLADVADSVPGGYWDSWVPGYGEAAAQAADGGMRALLDEAGHTIVGLEDTTIDRIGQMVSEGLGRGDSIQTVGKAIRAEVEAPARAELIANTEYARAMTTASEQTYAESGVVEEEEWLGEGDMCPECQVNADASPIKQGDDWPNGSVPVHPRCRCAQAGKVSVPGE